MLLEWIVNIESDHIDLVRRVGYYLAYLPTAVISRLHRNGLAQYYLYVVLSCLKDHDPATLGHFLVREIVSAQVVLLADTRSLGFLFG